MDVPWPWPFGYMPSDEAPWHTSRPGINLLRYEAAFRVDRQAIDELNRDLARVETVKKFAIVPRPFSIEHGELTPTLKVKRKHVSENFSEQIEAMYRE